MQLITAIFNPFANTGNQKPHKRPSKDRRSGIQNRLSREERKTLIRINSGFAEDGSRLTGFKQLGATMKFAFTKRF